MRLDGKIFIVRHGESEWNCAGLVQGQSTAAPGLTTAGLEQAHLAANSLAGSNATLVMTSDLRRTRETASVIRSVLGIPMRTEPLLCERSYGAAEGSRSVTVDPQETGVTGEVVTDVDAHPPGGESLRDLYDRICGFLRDLPVRFPGRRIILVTHGGPIRVARAYLAGIGVEEMTWPSVPNGSILEVSFADIAARSFNSRRGR